MEYAGNTAYLVLKEQHTAVSNGYNQFELNN